ncbi:MAG TPA: hypothetical protein DDW77_11985 [Verrucomicrobiales bacterium]|nr:hypothetical protein [Verrucomicrobiales bacterium]HCQ84098.1 hypothetical protein [Verrucomicrobiales bacterium]
MRDQALDFKSSVGSFHRPLQKPWRPLPVCLGTVGSLVHCGCRALGAKPWQGRFIRSTKPRWQKVVLDDPTDGMFVILRAALSRGWLGLTLKIALEPLFRICSYSPSLEAVSFGSRHVHLNHYP